MEDESMKKKKKVSSLIGSLRTIPCRRIFPRYAAAIRSPAIQWALSFERR